MKRQTRKRNWADKRTDMKDKQKDSEGQTRQGRKEKKKSVRQSEMK